MKCYLVHFLSIIPIYLQQTDIFPARKSEETGKEVASQLEFSRCKGAEKQKDRGKIGPSNIPQGGQCISSEPGSGYSLAREGTSTQHHKFHSMYRTR
jgi:hypothetical protein